MHIQFTPEQLSFFLTLVDRDPGPDGCWIWKGPRGRRGYGLYFVHLPDGTYRQRQAHRISYMVFVGEIPDGLLIRHTCDTPPCIRPDHLIPGTDGDNVRDMFARGRANSWMMDPNRVKRGEDAPRAKLTAQQVREIRVKWGRGMSQRQLCLDYGVAKFTIHSIVHRITWKHVD